MNNPNWEEADVQEEEFRAQRDRELLDKVHSILTSAPNKECLMIDVINELNKDVKGEEAKDEIDDSESQSRKARKIRAGKQGSGDFPFTDSLSPRSLETVPTRPTSLAKT